jgi:hypothetical protein
MGICKTLLSTADQKQDTMFAITVRTIVGYPSWDNDADIKYLAAGEDGLLKPTPELQNDDDGRRIFSGLEAFESHFAAVKT